MKLYYDTGNSATYPQDAAAPSWTRVSAICEFPKIKSRMDETGICIIKLRDYQGALHGTWDAREWTRMKVEDEDSNVIFLGYLTGKTYEEKEMTMVISGISKVFQWFPIDKNYILAEGYIDDIAFGADATRLDLVQGNEARDDFAWNVDKWIDGRDVAIMVRENSTGNIDETWLVTGIGQVGGEDVFADAGWENDADEVYYRVREINETTFNCVVTPTLGGGNIPNTNTISKIEVFYDYKVTWTDWVEGGVTLQANRDGTWQNIVNVFGGRQWWGSESKRVAGSYELMGDDLTDYLTLDGANWDEMLGIRFVFGGDYMPLDGTQSLFIDYIKVVVTYNADNISPISETITANGASFIQVAGVDWETKGITDGGADDGDIFDIGENCKQIIEDIEAACHTTILQLTASTKYMAQHFKGNYGIQILKKVCLLEGWHYWEDYTDGVFGTVYVGHLDDLEDSGVDITQADYDHDWLYEGDPNYYSKVTVYGSAAYRIQQSATSESVESPKTKVFYEETITTNKEALDIAVIQLAEWSVKHPSIKIPLKGVNAAIKVGTEITLTMVRPTVAEANYPIRMIERERLGHGGIKTTVYAGMGHSSIEEELADRINKIMYLAQKSHADRLITTPPGVGVTGVAWGDIADATAGVEAIIIAELVDGQSINNAIDALIAVIALDDIQNPAGATEFNFANKHLHFTWVAPASGAHEGAFEIEASGAFSGDLVHIHQHTGNPGATYMVYIECEDVDAKCLHLKHGGDELDFGSNGLLLSADARITEFDSDVNLAGGDTKVPTDGAAKAYADAKVSNEAYDPDAWVGVDDVAPSKDSCRDVFVTLEAMLLYKGTWTPSEGMPTDPVVGDYWISDGDGIETDLYYGTYNFKDDEVGTTDNDISLINSNTGDDSNPEAIIVASEDGHKKVVKFVSDGDNETFWRWRHDHDNKVAETIEFWVKYIDNGQGRFDFRINNEGSLIVMANLIDSATNKLRINHAATFTEVDISPNIWHHIRFQFDCSTDHQWVWLDGDSVVSDVAFFQSRTATTIRFIDFHFYNGGGVSSLEYYIDAFGESWDDDYDVGDNLLIEQAEAFYEYGDWIVWNGVQWDRLRGYKGDNILVVSPGDNIQVAIDELEKVGSGSIFLEPGTHQLTAALTINSATMNGSIYGVGDATIIDIGADRAAFELTNALSWTFKNFKIEASDLTTAAQGIINITEANDNQVIVEKVTIVGDGTNGYGVNIASDNCIVRNCTINTIRGAIVSTAGHKVNCYENVISDCNIYGIWLTDTNHVMVYDNYIDGADDIIYGILVAGGDYNGINDNHIIDCSYGIWLDNQADYNKVIGNSCISCTFDGIHVNLADWNSISANICNGNDDGIHLTVNASNNYITVNMFANNTTNDINDLSDGSNYILTKAKEIITVYPQIMPDLNSGAVWQADGIGLTLVDDAKFKCWFYLDDKIDPDQDVIITFTWFRVDVGGDAIHSHLFLSRIDADGGAGAVIDNDIDIELDGCGFAECEHYVHTLASANVVAGDLYLFTVAIKEAGKIINVLSVSVQYHKLTSGSE